ncbi:MAG: DUF4859 domain-containing protein [Bacteroidales bacterium]|nr:DUF4859 domain-containing protein [Bacteroidales bacterium]
MKKIFVYMALASLALTACHTKEYFENDGIPVEPEPEPEIVYEGEGNLEKENKDGSVAETNSTYTWKAEGTSITIDAYIDTGQYIHGDDEFGGGEYCIGWFTLPIATMNEFLGLDVRADLTAATFWAVNPDGTKVDSFTSYAPGMWVDDTGASSNWSAGSAFWQWYVWEDQGVTYDMSQGDYPGIIYLGCQPANAAAVAGKTVTSKAKLTANGTEYDWTVNFHYAETEKVVEGSGKLQAFVWDDDDNYHAEERLSSYSYTMAAESGLEITVEVNTQEWIDSKDWMIGWFDFPRDAFKEVVGFDPAELDESTFYALDDFGDPVEEMTSYKPGMWVDEKGLPAPGYSEGVAYWQWYIWGGKSSVNKATGESYTIGYDYDYEKHPDIFVVGGNPGNNSKVTFDEPFTATAMMKSGDKEYPMSITYIFHEVILPETEGYPEGVADGVGTPYPYGGGADGDHQISWYFDEECLTVDVDAYVPTIVANGDYVFTAAVIPTDVMASYLGVDVEQLFDTSYFYPLEPDGSAAGDWTCDNHPGQWVDADGKATGWSTGSMYWWYQWGDHKYEGHFTDGLFLVGTNPGNVSAVAGKTVVSKAKMGDKLLTVKVTFHDAYPTAKTGKIGPHKYSWAITDAGVDIVAEVSAAAKDDSWGWVGFPLNEVYLNQAFGIDVDALTEDFEAGFYPIGADGSKLESWTSYVPGMWFGQDGNAGGYAFWQYYTTQEHEFPGFYNMFYVGKNPGNTYTPGETVTSKAILGGKAFNFTMMVVD